MKTVLKILAGVIVLAVVAIGGYLYQQHRARKAGVLTENIVHEGDTWSADFTARIGAPEPQVFDTIKDVERAKSDQVKASRSFRKPTERRPYKCRSRDRAART